MELRVEQAAVINHNDGNLLVSASAGSGKTFTMIRRLIRIISEGKATVNEILAVTFTEKAASEMKDKLRKAMCEEIANGNDKLKNQLADVNSADICTLHSFCARLIRNYFFELGLSADFEVADSSKINEIKQDVVSKLFEELYEKEDAVFLMLVSRHSAKRRDDRLKKAVFAIYEYITTKENPEQSLNKSLFAVTESGFDELYKKYICLLNKKLSDVSVSALVLAQTAEYGGYTQYSAYIKKLVAYANGEVQAERMPTVKNLDENGEKLKEKIKLLKKQITAVLEEIEVASDYESQKRRALSCKRHTDALISLTLEFAKKFEEEKRELNVVDFNDLERFALKALLNDEIKKEVCEKYKYVFTDEYQDTNDVQEIILSLVSNGNLFMVGDLKQSIYGFRGCNPDLFKNKENQLAGGGVIYLNCNFRSSDAVINGVNAIFDRAMTQGFSSVDYKNTSRLVRSGFYPEGSGEFSIDILTTGKSKRLVEEPRIYDLTEEVAVSNEVTVGDFIGEIILKELGKEYFDCEDKCYKKIGYGDIAVLTRNRTEYADVIIKSLVKMGIPVAAESKNSITEYAEIKTLCDILQLLDNFYQDIPLCSAMKSLYSFTDDELAEIRIFGNGVLPNNGKNAAFYQAYAAYLEKGEGVLKEKLKSFDAYIRKIRLLSAELTAGEILERVVSESMLDVKLYASATGKQKIRRVNRFISEANAGKYTVKEFLERIESAEDEFTLAETSDDEAVKMLTIHSSKGLEYPVVIVAGIDKKFNYKDAQNEIIIEKDYGFAVKYYDDENKTYGETLPRLYFKELIKNQCRREELRLFYVALTRAKYSLKIVGENVLPSLGENDASQADCYADFIPNDIPVNEFDESFIKTAELNRSVRKIAVGETNMDFAQKIKNNFEFCYPHCKNSITPMKTSVTESLKRTNDDVYVVNDLFAEEIPQTSAEKGTAMHKFLERCDFNFVSAQNETERLLNCGEISKEEYSLLDLTSLQKICDSGILKSLKSCKLYKEKQFLASCPATLALGDSYEGDIILQGVIDLLALNGDSAVIFDYKYSHKNAAGLIKTYSKQLQLYKYAVEKSLKIKVENAFIISLATAEIIKIDI